MALLEKALLFIEPTALALVLVFAYSFVGRSGRSPRTVQLIMGCIFGACAVVAMLDPIQIAEGIIVDVRSLFVGMAAAYFGVLGGLITLAFGVVTRVLIGGNGTMLGVMGMALSTCAGLAWAYWVRPRMHRDTRALTVLGLMISSHLFVGLLLPDPVRWVFLFNLAPVLFIANLVGAIILGKLIERERGLLIERDQLLSAIAVDPLTQLMNRESAVSSYDAMAPLADPSRGRAMLCIDVDHFKTINDTYGHLRGDAVLIGIAQRMSSCLRPQDIFARMSGDEFVIVLNNLTADQARSVANRCQNSVSADPLMADGVEIPVSVSVGCTWVSNHPAFSDLRFAADEALYRAKEMGRNCLAFDKIQGVLGRGHEVEQIAA